MLRVKVLAKDAVAKVIWELVKDKTDEEKLLEFANIVRKEFGTENKISFAFRGNEVVLVEYLDKKADGKVEYGESESILVDVD